MAGNAGLASLFRDFGQRWEIEHVEHGTEWVACCHNGEVIHIIGARDLGALRYRIEAAEREEAEARQNPGLT
jgi:hypothetical protein